MLFRSVGSEITGGVDLTGPNAENSLRALNNGYSLATGSATVTASLVLSGTFGTGDLDVDKQCRFDPDIASGSEVAVFVVQASSLTSLDRSNLIAVSGTFEAGSLVRRLTAKSDVNGNFVGGDTYTHLKLVVVGAGAKALTTGTRSLTWPIADVLNTVADSLGAIVAQQVTFEGEGNIPEIDIRVDSVAVTAKSRKLKAKWTPELGQDLNAYHNLDAEVELTSILSEQIGLEIDQEMLGELVRGATAATLYWSRRPGKFLDRVTGTAIVSGVNDPNGADFTGNVSMWYETLVETINDVSAAIHRKTLRGGANFLVCGPEVANILEFTTGFRANVVHDDAKGTIGAVKAGSLSKKWDVMVDPYFPRNLILVGRKGSSFLESGFV